MYRVQHLDENFTIRYFIGRIWRKGTDLYASGPPSVHTNQMSESEIIAQSLPGVCEGLLHAMHGPLLPL